MKRSFLALLLFACLEANSQTRPSVLTMLDSGRNCSIRGRIIPSYEATWISGSNANVAKFTDAGKTWKWMRVAGYEKTDFRGIHDGKSVFFLSVGTGGWV